MTTVTLFSPTIDQNFSWQPTLDGQQYTALVTWSLFGQRWILNVYALSGVLVMTKPMTASPVESDINLLAGYFTTSTLVYRESSNAFEVTP